MLTVQHFLPRCELEFHTPVSFYSVEGKAEGKADPSDDMISVSTSKSLGSSAGTFTIDLTYKNFGTWGNPETWYDRLNPMDLVVIKMGKNNTGKLDTVMVGLIDEVRRVRSMPPNGESPTRKVRINGRDFGKVFLKAMLKFFPQLDDGTLPLELLDGNETLLGLKEFFMSEEFEYGTPAQLIYKGITKILHNLMMFEATTYNTTSKQPVITTLKEILRFKLCRTSNQIPFINTLAEYEGSFWNFIESAVNQPFFELFVDTRTNDEIAEMVPSSIVEYDSYGIGAFEQTWGDDNSKVCLFLRPTPFDQSNWDTLTTHTLSDADIMDEDLGRSDHENQNMWRVRPAVNILGTEVYDREVKPVLDIDNVKRYGISYYEPELYGLSAEQDSEKWADIVKYGDALSQKLKTWYWRNIWFENGSLTIAGNAKIKVGQRVRNPDEYHNHIYYVEGVSQSFVNRQSWTTTIQVTRGQDYTKMDGTASVQIPTEIKTYDSTDLQNTYNPQSTDTVNATEPTYHVVSAGETLSSICKKYYNTVSADLIDKIVQANPQIDDPNVIYPGQKFKIPDK